MEMTEDTQVLACRICLQVDCKLYSLKCYKLDESYQLLTGLSLDDEDTLPMSVCVECSTHLCKYQQFRDKSHVAYKCLMDMLKYNFEVTLDDIKEINRNKLRSHLSTIHREPNYIDYHFVEETPIKLESVAKFENTCDFVDNLATDNDLGEDSNKNDVLIVTASESQNDESEEKYNTSQTDFVEKNHYDNQFQDESHLIELEIKPTAEFCSEVEFDETNSIKDCFDTKDDQRKDSDHEDQNIYKDKKQKNVVTPTLNATKSKDMNKKEIIKKPKDIIQLWTNDFNIKSLTFEEQKEMFYKRKSSDCYMNAKYKCDYCFKGFIRETALKTHMVDHSEKNGHLVCEICQKRWKDKKKFRCHTAHHTHIYSCKSCPYSTQEKSTAKLHFDWHKGQIYKCKLCNASFVRLSSLKTHERIKHPSNNVCSLCGYSFLGKNGVKLHQKLKHRQENVELPLDSPRCELCDISFVSIEALQTHYEVSLRHGGGGPSKRNEPIPEHVLGQKNKTKSVKPKIIKHGKTVCEQCDVQLRSPLALKQHVARYHLSERVIGPRDTLCHVCGKMFRCAALLREHLPIHSETASFSCQYCSKKFKSPRNLKTHERIHYNVRYPCPQCERTFNDVGNRNRHVTYTHSDVKNVKCDYCDKRFKSYGEKKIHTDHVHLNKPWPLKKNRVRKERSTVKITRKKETTEDSMDAS